MRGVCPHAGYLRLRVELLWDAELIVYAVTITVWCVWCHEMLWHHISAPTLSGVKWVRNMKCKYCSICSICIWARPRDEARRPGRRRAEKLRARPEACVVFVCLCAREWRATWRALSIPLVSFCRLNLFLCRIFLRFCWTEFERKMFEVKSRRCKSTCTLYFLFPQLHTELDKR